MSPRVVARSAQLDARPEQRPERRGLVLVRHADAARVDEPAPADAAVELDVRVAEHDRRCDTPASIGAMRASGESGVTISSSLRGEAWQKSTSPSPSTPTDGAAAARPSTRAARGRAAPPPSASASTRRRRVDPRAAGVESQPRLDELALAVAADRAPRGRRARARRPPPRTGTARLRRRRRSRSGRRPSCSTSARTAASAVVVAMDVVERRDPHGAESRTFCLPKQAPPVYR